MIEPGEPHPGAKHDYHQNQENARLHNDSHQRTISISKEEQADDV
jgi:hypothetical protein